MSRKLTEKSTTDDLIQPFQIDGAAVRGHLVRLGAAAAELLGRHAYPQPVLRLLGEAVALTSLLASALKFDGIFSLQIQADGPITLMVVDCRSDGDLRAMATYKAEAFAGAGTDDLAAAGCSGLLGKGHLAFTVDQGPDMERYQGIVELDGPTLADCLEWMDPLDPAEDVEERYRTAMKANPQDRTTKSARIVGWFFSNYHPDRNI